MSESNSTSNKIIVALTAIVVTMAISMALVVVDGTRPSCPIADKPEATTEPEDAPMSTEPEDAPMSMVEKYELMVSLSSELAAEAKSLEKVDLEEREKWWLVKHAQRLRDKLRKTASCRTNT